ncbi:hypothetical protein OOK39_06285 [Streptomyces sp. NBC_00264]|uniref:hypothetical protein n=1 Tax=unclassified Streptomyces TaxID=2593676 RepID=UPI00224FA691|nr:MULTISPECIES: hypothetical protein [unclassified Streptomyces]MCX5158892.1 hypothetical protein [Streptomyces sp. NBC_00305]MCX5217415.1 hypothetical protein [Streptomyces sp. NBC_00264]
MEAENPGIALWKLKIPASVGLEESVGLEHTQRRHDRRRRLAKVGLHIGADRLNVLIHVAATDDVDGETLPGYQ